MALSCLISAFFEFWKWGLFRLVPWMLARFKSGLGSKKGQETRKYVSICGGGVGPGRCGPGIVTICRDDKAWRCRDGVSGVGETIVVGAVVGKVSLEVFIAIKYCY